MIFTVCTAGPDHSSVAVTFPGPLSPPKANPTVLVPAPPKPDLAIFKSFTSVQLVPFQVSVFATLVGTLPPNAKAAVCIPSPAKLPLAVFKTLTAVQLVPFQDSVFAIATGPGPEVFPPNANAAV